MASSVRISFLTAPGFHPRTREQETERLFPRFGRSRGISAQPLRKGRVSWGFGLDLPGLDVQTQKRACSQGGLPPPVSRIGQSFLAFRSFPTSPRPRLGGFSVIGRGARRHGPQKMEALSETRNSPYQGYPNSPEDPPDRTFRGPSKNSGETFEEASSPEPALSLSNFSAAPAANEEKPRE